jgi:crotonobetainyl-CoA:carnitine CoA-transferase CaiB-like acyl-CoA transferase
MSAYDPPLAGLVVLDLSQFLSGPYAALRLMDLGARVIKIERPDGGDLCRRLYLSDTEIGGTRRCSTRSTATRRAWP